MSPSERCTAFYSSSTTTTLTLTTVLIKLISAVNSFRSSLAECEGLNTVAMQSLGFHTFNMIFGASERILLSVDSHKKHRITPE